MAYIFCFRIVTQPGIEWVAFRFTIEESHKVQSPYTFTQLSKIDGQSSIIAKLFLLKDISCDQVRIRCALVSNAFLKVGNKTFSESERLAFNNLDEKSQSTIKKALCTELSRGEVDLTDLHYIYTSMDLSSPEDAIKGKITGSFEKIKGCEPIKPNALYRLIFDTVQEKAYGADEADDWTDPKVWKKANPSLGITVGIDKVKAACESAKENPARKIASGSFA